MLIVAVAATAGGEGEAGTSEMSVSDNFNATGLPILNEPVTFRVAMIDHWNTPDFNDKQMVREWTENTNVRIRLDPHVGPGRPDQGAPDVRHQ